MLEIEIFSRFCLECILFHPLKQVNYSVSMITLNDNLKRRLENEIWNFVCTLRIRLH